MMETTLMILIIVAWFGANGQLQNGNSSHCSRETTQDEDLHDHLFGCKRKFSKIFPKLKSNEKQLPIGFRVTIQNINEIIASENEADLLLRFDMEWQSDLLRWNSSSFDITELAVDASSVWTPEWHFEESLDDFKIAAKRRDTVYMTSEGNHSMSFLRRVRLSCQDNACLFPRDSYKCNFTFYLLRVNSSLVNLPTNSREAKKEKTESGTWEIEFGFNKSVLSKNKNGHVFIGLHFKAKVKRRHAFYLATVVFPLGLLGSISVLSVILPAITGDRIALLLSTLLATMIYLETIFKYLPNSSKSFPAIVWLIILILISTGLQIILAGICLNWANKFEQKKKPGKKFVFLVFRVMKFIIFFLPMLYFRIKLITERRGKRNVGNAVDEFPDTRSSGSPQLEDKRQSNDDDVKCEKEESYRSAIKVVDILAMLLSIATFLAMWFILTMIYKPTVGIRYCEYLQSKFMSELNRD